MVSANMLDNYTTDELVRYYGLESNDEHVLRLVNRVETTPPRYLEKIDRLNDEISDNENAIERLSGESEALGEHLTDIAEIVAGDGTESSKIKKIQKLLGEAKYL
jgi:hypothetical protein